MTTDEARAALKQWPKHMRTAETLRGMLRYEQLQNDGETFSPCECGRGMSKAWRCPECLREMLAVAEGKP